MTDRRRPANRASSTPQQRRRALANEQRLIALGEAVDRRTGAPARAKQTKQSGQSRILSRLPLIGGLTRRAQISVVSAVVAVAVIAGFLGGGYLYAQWRFGQIHKITVGSEVQPISGQPFNILSVGSDSRVGLSGAAAHQTGATSGAVAGQRSDVVKIIHVDPIKGSISVLSIPRDTLVTLLANQSLYGKFNRINVNFGNGPTLVAQTITANFGIPLNNTIVVSFGGLINAATAVGGVRLNFPYPAADPYSGLRVSHAGCQLVTGFEALAVARSRHFYYNIAGHGVWPGNNTPDSVLYADGWRYDGSSDFGRIKRQDAFLNALLIRAKHLYNPISLNAFLSALPQGIQLDSNFSLNELIGLALRFHGISPSSIHYYTMPTIAATAPGVGDVLFVNQPAAQEMLVNVFGSQLQSPTNPPPNTALQTPMPPVVTTTTAAPSGSSSSSVATTATTVPVDQNSSFNPTPC